MNRAFLPHGPVKRLLLALSLAATPGACMTKEVGETAARTGLAIVRGACHAVGDCGVSCPEGTILHSTTLACVKAPL